MACDPRNLAHSNYTKIEFTRSRMHPAPSIPKHTYTHIDTPTLHPTSRTPKLLIYHIKFFFWGYLFNNVCFLQITLRQSGCVHLSHTLISPFSLVNSRSIAPTFNFLDECFKLIIQTNFLLDLICYFPVFYLLKPN